MDIFGTLTCRHVVMTTFGCVFWTHANNILEEAKFATHFILASYFILANRILLLLTFFEGGTVSVVLAPAKSSLLVATALSFAITFLRAFENGLFLDVFAVLRAFAGGDIKAQSEPGDVDPPLLHPHVLPPRLQMASVHCSTLATSCSRPNVGGLGALTTFLLWTSGVHSRIITSVLCAFMFVGWWRRKKMDCFTDTRIRCKGLLYIHLRFMLLDLFKMFQIRNHSIRKRSYIRVQHGQFGEKNKKFLPRGSALRNLAF